MTEDIRARIDEQVKSDAVVLFMKGTRGQPQCGFSATVVQILDELLPRYTTYDVLSDPELRQGIKEYSSWPTIPQLYVGGEFVGGCDIVKELYGTGELHQTLGLPVPERRAPRVELTEAAARFLRGAVEQSPGNQIHLRVDPGFQNRAYLGPPEPGELEAEAAGVKLLFDLPSAQRADGIRIDYAQTDHGHDLRVDNPNAPPPVRAMDVHELARRLETGESLHLLDVRTAEERERARIPGSRLLDAETAVELRALPRDSVLVFHCHHGGRSQQAAEHFRGLGFREVYNLAGGIDAWSQAIDPSVPRY